MDTEINPASLFRPVKKRKFLRRRLEDSSEHAQVTITEDTGQSLDGPSSLPQSGGLKAKNILDAARLRRLQRTRKGGIEFSATSRPTLEGDSQTSLTHATAEDLESERLQAMCDRFTAHTGQTVDVDKHMMAYIESEMAKRYRGSVSTEETRDNSSTLNTGPPAPPVADLPKREPASLGKLHEIDLGQETKLQNIARTEAATRKLAGNDNELASAVEADSKATSSGKELRSWRNRNRRTREDVERDRLVEEVLRESKLDVYDGPLEDEEDGVGEADGQAADDRVAEQFRKDFLDAIQSRRRVARARNTKTTKTEAPRGPKLGGSRSARAAMREMQEKSGRK
ncbi:telomere length and silencing 1 family protein [Aspergillus saccharolyticus JOP 1030-1]|uniref:Hepatocellular carcinoma-associated antigen 59-domain-containing protein n=1 Tax=Aspergillus saccharolyticus JOP 1030-1 TaxID=1450539 RepID=A0A318ZLX3_9EURO|nr:hypothetical protein BP01DRAFT_335192 [Aspergillus saccharolyticus JOP 1030-1]PYH47725.1 hypothetical protein BP01DRAFT_335192 [Aspergillus saccharolyticus JOP 1030-1]